MTDARLACTSTDYCRSTLRPTSQCVDGYCDNPYQYGCLTNVRETYKLRVCHSEDPPDAVERGLCRSTAPLHYPEIRIMSQNWESPFLEAWILQILLSEVLDIPTTLETGDPTKNVNFYHPDGRFDYGEAYYMQGLDRAAKVGDCRLVQQEEGQPYKGCGHAMLEIWHGYDEEIEKLVKKGAVTPKTFIGIVGEEGWYLPKYTADKDASLIGYFGMTGQANRRKLADRFLRPTTWGDYCTIVVEDPDDCLMGNNETGAAVRPPQTEEERDSFFVDGLYTGHFRKTQDNDCDAWPLNCTGHFLDYPCDWSSFFIGQAHHLDIPLKSNGNLPGAKGYTYEHMLQVWYAANWTKSDVIGYWWRPDSLYQEFQRTDFELQRVVLPPTNHQCIDNRLDVLKRCGERVDLDELVGPSEGSCDVPPIPMYKLLSTGLDKLVNNPDIPVELRSPAYDVLKEFSVNTFALGEIFEAWFQTGIDKYSFDSRDAVCNWVSENLDDLLRFVPESYPRTITEMDVGMETWIAVALGCIAACITIVTACATHKQRRRRVFQFAQVEFVFLLLVGMFFVSLAAIFTALPPTDPICIAGIWFLNVGYTLELVPLVVKIAAINRLMQAARRMKRIKLPRVYLFGAVAVLTGFVVVFMIAWTVVSPPSKQGSYLLDEDAVTEGGATIVTVSYVCDSESQVWTISLVTAQTLMLLCASILAFLTRKMTQDVNDTNTIATLIYWNFLCILLRIILLLLAGSVSSVVLRRSLSMILSVDTMATVLIYFLPKFLSKEAEPGSRVSITMVNARVLNPQSSSGDQNQSTALSQQFSNPSEPACRRDSPSTGQVSFADASSSVKVGGSSEEHFKNLEDSSDQAIPGILLPPKGERASSEETYGDDDLVAPGNEKEDDEEEEQ